jgi:GT2 family glycosyltransferase|nr:glycosyltransferase [Neorhizobium tomejilense]
MAFAVSVVILTHRRDSALSATIARLASSIDPTCIQLLLVDNNADGVDRSAALEAFPNAVYINEKYNMGVTAGRNRAIRDATGDVILFLDDDALLEVGGDFHSDLLSMFEKDDRLGVVAFRSFVGKNRVEEDKEFPHTDKSLDRSKGFDTFRFIGVAHAIRRSLLKETGLYCPSFFYGMEEFDLAFRFLKLGYRIEYRPDFKVQHMKSESGRLSSSAVVQRMYTNKLAVGWMHLPFGVFVKSATAWFLKTLLDSRNPLTPLRSIGDFLAMASHGQIEPRRPSQALVAEIRRLGGTPWR